MVVVVSVVLGAALASAGSCEVLPFSPASSAQKAERHPAVLVVHTPGYAASAYTALSAALARERLAVWSLRCPLEAQSPLALVRAEIPAAAAQVGARALVGHGLGGMGVAQSVAEGHSRPEAVVLLGVPLRGAPETSPALLRHLAALPLPEAPMGLSAWLSEPWPLPSATRTAAEVLLGDPLPPLEAVSPVWLSSLQAWASPEAAWAVDLRAAEVAVWAGAGGLDNLAPAESMRPCLPPESFSRYGYLALDDHDPDSAALLGHREALRDLARWLRRTL